MNEQTKQTRDIFTRRIIATKNIRSFSRKKLIASNVKFLQSLGFIVQNIWDGWLNIGEKPIFDDRIVRIERTSIRMSTPFGHSDEIRIFIQQQNLYMLPCESFLNAFSEFFPYDESGLRQIQNRYFVRYVCMFPYILLSNFKRK